MSASGARLVHAIPGRARFKFDQIKGDPERAEEIRERLSGIRGIHRVETNPLTGSVLAIYDSAALESLDFHFSIASALGISLSDVDAADSRLWFASSQNGSAQLQPATLSSAIGSAFGEVNAGVERLTGGVGSLRDLVPLTLFLLGARSLLVAEKSVLPSWYDYFWFAFSSYFLLNRTSTATD
jgi:hypothetical protein